MKILNIMLLAIVMMMLSACGGSSGGGATPAVVTQTYTGLEVVEGKEAEVASVVGTGDDAVYTYNYQGTPIDVTLNGLEVDDFVRITGGDIALFVGGTSYSYSRFGVVASRFSLTGSSITPAAAAPLYDNGEVFYVGQKTSSMPTTGIAKYTGDLTTLSSNGDFYDGFVEFEVNYGGKTMEGTATVFSQNMELDGTIDGSDFSGIMLSGPENVGSYHGSFFGPNAEELGGAGTFNDGGGTFGFSFGAKKEEL